MREVTAVLQQLALAGVGRLDGVGRVDDFAHRGRELVSQASCCASGREPNPATRSGLAWLGWTCSYVSERGKPFPLRPGDRIYQDLRVHPDEIEDIVRDAAERTRRSFDDCERNPLYGQVETVGDAVLFLNHQQKLAGFPVG